MKSTYLVAVDVGVSFVKAGVYDQEGQCRATAQNGAPGEYPEPGVFLQSNQGYLTVVTKTLKEAVERSGVDTAAIAAVGMSCALGGATGLDKDGNVVFDWSIISDTRYHPYVTKMQETAGDLILRLSGTTFPIFGPKLLWWQTEFPDAYKQVHKFLFLQGYLIGSLCEMDIEEAFADRTYLQISSLADIKNEKWSEEICGTFDIDSGLLPRIVDCERIVGKLSATYADACGLKAGTPFVAGAGDKPAGSIGAGLVQPGVLIDESASYGALSLCVDTYQPDLKFRTLETMPSPIKGHYFPWCYFIGSGVTHAWFRDNFAGDIKQQAEKSGVSPFELLDQAAADVPPGSEGLLALGLWGGRGFPSDPDIRGLWIGQTWSHKREHFYRALLESFAYEYACVLNVMRETYPDMEFDQVRVIGGGARSDLLNQIKCDVMGLDYTKLNRDDFALLGDIIIAGHAVGIYEDMKTTCRRFVNKTDTYTPNGARSRAYQPYIRHYAGLFDKVRNVFRDLQETSK